MKGWREGTLAELCLPKAQRVTGSIPIYSSSGITGYHEQAKCSGPGVIMGRYGTIGQVFFSRNDYWPLNTTLYVENFHDNDEKFVYFFLKTLEWEKFNDKSAVPGINRNDVHKEVISFPEVKEQRAIAAVLSNLDDKIDLLHRQNATLEAMAEALFKQWFVVKAKEEWKTGTLGDICECITEKFNPSIADYTTKYVGLEHIDKKIIYLSRFGESREINSAKFKFQMGDILFGKLRPYFHKVCFAPFDGVCSTDILVIRPKDENLFLFSLFAFNQCEVVDFATYCSNGTRMPRIDWKTLKTFELSLPDKENIHKFNRMCTPWMEKIRYNQTQIRTLENLRDTLLPKLMSGEVRVDH